MKAGFTSTSLRKYTIQDVVRAARESGARSIEWGTDFHIRTQDDAKIAKSLCDDARIPVRSLGTYYRVGQRDLVEWERLCAIARTMGARYMRTWLGTKGSAETDEAGYTALVDETLAMADVADKYGVVISNECHPNTYNDTTASSLRYLKDTAGRVSTYYQSWYRDREGDFEKLDSLFPCVSDVHVSFSELVKFQKGYKHDETFITDIVTALAHKKFTGLVFIEFTAEDKLENLVSDVRRLTALIDVEEIKARNEEF